MAFVGVGWLLRRGLWLPLLLPLLVYRLLLAWQLKARHRTLAGRVVLLTGASSGLGEALAHAFYAAGCKVILAARRVEELQRVQSALLASNPSIVSHPPVILQLDLSDLRTLAAKADEALQFHGRVDVLVNNGGISYRGEATTTNLDVDLKLMVVNYFGHVALTKALLPSMIKQQSGHIVAVSSVQGKIAIPYRSAYAASKHAMQAFFDTLRAELSSQKVAVTVVSPGYIKTNLSMNAVTASGATYGVTDSSTESGMSPSQAAQRILAAVALVEQDVILAPVIPRVAIYLRTLCPSVFFYFMQKRAQKGFATQ